MDTRRLVLIAIATLGIIDAALSLFYFYESFHMPADRLSLVKDGFDLAVSRVLLPMFTTVVTAALAYIFGKPLVVALADRLRFGGENPAPRSKTSSD